MTSENTDSIIKKLDLILIILLAKSGLSQKEIAQILGMSNKTVGKIFGKSYDKLQEK